jgi:ribosomal protein L7/L12
MRDDTIVSETALKTAVEEVGKNGPDTMMATIVQAEPILGNFLQATAAQVAGKLALSGAPHPVIAGVHNDMLWACSLVYLALRKGSYEIWEGTALGERLQQLEVTAQEGGDDTDTEPRQQVLLLGIAARSKTRVMHCVSSLTGRPLREVRKLLEQAPVVIFADVPAPFAAVIQAQLEQIGGRIVVQPVPPVSEADPSTN